MGELLVQGLVDLVEHGPCLRKFRRKILGHADGLAPLTRKDECAHRCRGARRRPLLGAPPGAAETPSLTKAAQSHPLRRVVNNAAHNRGDDHEAAKGPRPWQRTGMIVRPRPTLVTVMFALRGSILPQVAPTVITLTAFSVVVVAAEQRWPWAFPVTAGVGPFTLIGLALSIFLSFRNNACYDRWWEARKVWGSLIVETRGLARTIPALLPGEEHAALRRPAS